MLQSKRELSSLAEACAGSIRKRITKNKKGKKNKKKSKSKKNSGKKTASGSKKDKNGASGNKKDKWKKKAKTKKKMVIESRQGAMRDGYRELKLNQSILEGAHAQESIFFPKTLNFGDPGVSGGASLVYEQAGGPGQPFLSQNQETRFQGIQSQTYDIQVSNRVRVEQLVHNMRFCPPVGQGVVNPPDFGTKVFSGSLVTTTPKIEEGVGDRPQIVNQPPHKLSNFNEAVKQAKESSQILYQNYTSFSHLGAIMKEKKKMLNSQIKYNNLSAINGNRNQEFGHVLKRKSNSSKKFREAKQEPFAVQQSVLRFASPQHPPQSAQQTNETVDQRLVAQLMALATNIKSSQSESYQGHPGSSGHQQSPLGAPGVANPANGYPQQQPTQMSINLNFSTPNPRPMNFDHKSASKSHRGKPGRSRKKKSKDRGRVARNRGSSLKMQVMKVITGSGQPPSILNNGDQKDQRFFDKNLNILKGNPNHYIQVNSDHQIVLNHNNSRQVIFNQENNLHQTVFNHAKNILNSGQNLLKNGQRVVSNGQTMPNIGQNVLNNSHHNQPLSHVNNHLLTKISPEVPPFKNQAAPKVQWIDSSPQYTRFEANDYLHKKTPPQPQSYLNNQILARNTQRASSRGFENKENFIPPPPPPNIQNFHFKQEEGSEVFDPANITFPAYSEDKVKKRIKKEKWDVRPFDKRDLNVSGRGRGKKSSLEMGFNEKAYLRDRKKKKNRKLIESVVERRGRRKAAKVDLKNFENPYKNNSIKLPKTQQFEFNHSSSDATDMSDDVLENLFSSQISEIDLDSNYHLKNFQTSESHHFDNSSPPRQDLEPIYRLRDEYRMEEVLGKGSFSVVKRITRKSDSKSFALKLYKTSKSFPTARGEGHILKLLKHPGIIRFERFYIKENRTHVIMEYFQNAITLAEYISKKGRLSIKETQRIGRQLFEIVHFIHNKGISHRDLKPENILINPKKRMIKLIDFGFGIKQISKSTKHFSFVGTLSYMAPEVVAKRECMPQPTDLWSLGVILVKMYTGKSPFKAKDRETLRKAIRGMKFNKEVMDILPKRLTNLVKNLLVLAPEKRYTAMRALGHLFFND